MPIVDEKLGSYVFFPPQSLLIHFNIYLRLLSKYIVKYCNFY